MRRRICIVTSTRAEYGLLYWLMKEIREDSDLALQIIVAGMHLSLEFGLTYRQIEKDGFNQQKDRDATFFGYAGRDFQIHGTWHDRFCGGVC